VYGSGISFRDWNALICGTHPVFGLRVGLGDMGLDLASSSMSMDS
jgi:hypothetical protein